MSDTARSRGCCTSPRNHAYPTVGCTASARVDTRRRRVRPLEHHVPGKVGRGKSELPPELHPHSSPHPHLDWCLRLQGLEAEPEGIARAQQARAPEPRPCIAEYAAEISTLARAQHRSDPSSRPLRSATRSRHLAGLSILAAPSVCAVCLSLPTAEFGSMLTERRARQPSTPASIRIRVFRFGGH